MTPLLCQKRLPPVKGMFLGPKPKLAHFWLICLLDYITLIDQNFDPKTHPSCPLDLKNEKKTLFFQKTTTLGGNEQKFCNLAHI